MNEEIRFEDYEALIAKLARSWSNRTRLDFEELMQEGCLFFCKARKSGRHDPSKTKFSTYLWRGLNQRFANLAYRQNGHYGYSTTETIPPDLVPSGEIGAERRLNFLQAMDRAGRNGRYTAKKALRNRDARRLIGSVLQNPDKFAEHLKANGRSKVTQYTIQQYANQTWGWPLSRVWTAFKTIKTALKEV